MKSVPTCQSCLTKYSIIELLIENDRQSDEEEVLFVMHFDELGQPVLYKIFFTTDRHQELCKSLENCIHPDERKIDEICAFTPHNAYNTGGAPLDYNHKYIQPLASLTQTTLRVLISYMGQKSIFIPINAKIYAHTTSPHSAIEFCFLVFKRTLDSVEKPRVLKAN